MGHWHEILYGDTIHCYYIQDSLVTADKFTFGRYAKVTDRDIYKPFVPGSSFELLGNYKNNQNTIAISDSISWVKMKNEMEAFTSDLSIGLFVRVHPPELNQGQFELPFDTFGTAIYIGQLKSKPHDRLRGNQYYIQLNDVLGSVNDIEGFFYSHHGGNENQIAIIHADRNTPINLLNAVVVKIIATGYRAQNIYKTAIDTEHRTLGLIPVNRGEFPNQTPQSSPQ